MRFCEFVGCKYPVFGTDKVTGKGYCRSHQTQRTDFDRRTIIQKAMDKQNNLQSKIRGLGNAAVAKDDWSKRQLELWFDNVAEEIKKNPRCWECNMWIPEQFYRHASAHIFPKRIFKSIQTHPMNYLILGAGCGCHHKFDSSVEAASKMKVWKVAVQSFKQFENEIKEKHKYLDLFKQYQ